MPRTLTNETQRNVRAALNIIEQMMLDMDPESGAGLWYVLTALRGPDDATEDKTDTTAVIRAAAFPRLVKLHGKEHGRRSTFDGPCGWDRRFTFAGPGGWEYKEDTAVRFKDDVYDFATHFTGHIKTAAEVLGLDVVVDEDEDER